MSYRSSRQQELSKGPSVRPAAARWIAAALIAVATLVAGGAARAGDVTIETIALDGEPAPGVPGRTFRDFNDQTPNTRTFYNPSVNGSGDVAFFGRLDASDFSRDTGIWTGAPSSPAPAVLDGDPVPGAPGDTLVLSFLIGFATGPVINDGGEIAFFSRIRPAAGPVESSIWAGAPGALALVARSGQSAPGAGGEAFLGFEDPTLNDLGQVAFKATLDGSGGEGIWLGAAGDLRLVARSGDPAPGAAGRTFEDLLENTVTVETVPINDQGQTAFAATLDASDTSNDRGFWAGAPGDLTLRAREGDLAPGMQRAFVSFDRSPFFEGSLNAAGQVPIPAQTPSVGNIPVSGRGIWLSFDGDLSLLAGKGEAVPGIPGATFTSMALTRPVVNDAGQFAFIGDLIFDASPLTSARAILVGTRDGWQLAALEGDPAPGAPGHTFDSISRVVGLNRAGLVTFLARLDDSDPSNDFGLWAGTPGCLRLVVRKGDSLEVRPGDVRVVQTLGGILASGNADGRASSLNDAGRLVFPLFFTDGSEGIFYTDLPSGSPLDLLADLIVKVAALDAPQGTVNSLLQKLFAAQAKLEDGNDGNDVAAVHQLEAFIHAVMAQRGKKISLEDADQLIADAEAIIAALLDPDGTAVCAP